MVTPFRPALAQIGQMGLQAAAPLPRALLSGQIAADGAHRDAEPASDLRAGEATRMQSRSLFVSGIRERPAAQPLGFIRAGWRHGARSSWCRCSVHYL